MSLSTALHGVLNSAAYLRTWVPGSIFISLSTQLLFGQGHSQIISLGKRWLQQDAPNLPCELANDIFSKTRDATLLEDWEREISNRNAVYPFFTQFQIGFGCFFSSKWTLDLTRQPRSALFLLPSMLLAIELLLFLFFLFHPHRLCSLLASQKSLILSGRVPNTAVPIRMSGAEGIFDWFELKWHWFIYF